MFYSAHLASPRTNLLRCPTPGTREEIMTVMAPVGFGHGSFGLIRLTAVEIRKFACLARQRWDKRTCLPIGLHTRWHDMLVSFLESLKSCANATLDYCLFLALRENQGQPYYHKARERFVTWMREAFDEFQRWQTERRTLYAIVA